MKEGTLCQKPHSNASYSRFWGVLLTATAMATYNKYLVFGEFSPFLFKQIAIAFCQKAPLAFILQFFFVQKFAGRQISHR